MSKRYLGRFLSKLPNGDFLSVTIWPGKKDPNSEIIAVEVRHPPENGFGNRGWKTISRIAVYRSSSGKYKQLPENPQQ